MWELAYGTLQASGALPSIVDETHAARPSVRPRTGAVQHAWPAYAHATGEMSPTVSRTQLIHCAVGPSGPVAIVATGAAVSVAVLALSAATLAAALGRRLQSATYLAAGDASVAPLLAPPSAAALVRFPSPPCASFYHAAPRPRGTNTLGGAWGGLHGRS